MRDSLKSRLDAVGRCISCPLGLAGATGKLADASGGPVDAQVLIGHITTIRAAASSMETAKSVIEEPDHDP